MSIIQEALRKSQNSYLKNKGQQKGAPAGQKTAAPKSGIRTKAGPAHKAKFLVPLLLTLISCMIIISASYLISFFSHNKFLAKKINPPHVILPEEESSTVATDMTLSESPQQPKTDGTLPVQTVKPALVLNGIMYLDDNKPQAIINGYILEEGDTINGATVALIDKDYVLLNSNDSKAKKLKLNDQNVKAPIQDYGS